MNSTHQSSNSSSTKRALLLVGSALFIFAVYAPFLVGLAEKDAVVSALENRNLTQLPDLPKSLKEANQFPSAFNDYYSDHFGFRESLNFRHANIEKSLFKQSSSLPVTLGKDGWMFLGKPSLSPSEYNNPFSDIQKADVYTDQQLDQAVSSFTHIHQHLAKQGIHYAFVIAPNKHTIYSDKLPEGVAIKDGPSATDQLVNALRTRTKVHVIDLRPVLLAAKKWARVYYQFDTHWNSLGANVAQHAIMWEINQYFQNAPTPFILVPTQFAYYNETNFGDLLKIRPIPDAVTYMPKPIFNGLCVPEQISIRPADKNAVQRIQTLCDTGKLNALLFRDSFYGMLAPYLLRQFRQTTDIFSSINKDILDNEISLSKPDIVIEQIVERKLPYIPEFALD